MVGAEEGRPGTSHRGEGLVWPWDEWDPMGAVVRTELPALWVLEGTPFSSIQAPDPLRDVGKRAGRAGRTMVLSETRPLGPA